MKNHFLFMLKVYKEIGFEREELGLQNQRFCA